MNMEKTSAPVSYEEGQSETAKYRDLVVICFRAVLHREPEESDAAAFTNALHGGMPIYDFLSELMSTPEFIEASAPSASSTISLPPPVAPLADLLSLSLDLLQARLNERGCRLQLGPTSHVPADQDISPAKMQTVMRTLAIIDDISFVIG